MAADTEAPLVRDLMRLKPEDWTANGWAVRAGVSRTVWADMRRHGNPSRRTLEKLLGAAGSSLAEFEALRADHLAVIPTPAPKDAVGDVAGRGWRAAPRASIPLLGTAMAGEWDGEVEGIELAELRLRQVIDHLERPSSLAADGEAYALTMVDDSMWPRFRPGRRLIVSPRAPVAIGDDVVVRIHPAPGADPDVVPILVGELARFGKAVHALRQFHPECRFEIAAERVAAIHKIVGEAI